VETADCISKSILFTIGIALKSYPTPDDAVDALLNTGIAQLYFKGSRLIDKKIQAAKRLYLSMLKKHDCHGQYHIQVNAYGRTQRLF
jgi:hypothetical protein